MARHRHPAISTAAFALRPTPSPQTFQIPSSSRPPRFAPNPVPSIHAPRRTSVDSSMSSGSASPQESPELQTPESYPFSGPAHGSSDPKRTLPPVSYILANETRSAHSQDLTDIPGRDEPRPYLLAGGKDLGDGFPSSQTSLLAELLEGLDPQYIPHLYPAEVGPSFQTHNLPPPALPYLLDITQQYVETSIPWADVPPAVQNTLQPYVF